VTLAVKYIDEFPRLLLPVSLFAFSLSNFVLPLRISYFGEKRNRFIDQESLKIGIVTGICVTSKFGDTTESWLFHNEYQTDFLN